MPGSLGNLNPQKLVENKQQKPGTRLPWTSLRAQLSSILQWNVGLMGGHSSPNRTILRTPLPPCPKGLKDLGQMKVWICTSKFPATEFFWSKGIKTMNKRGNITRQIGCVFNFVHWIWNNKVEVTSVIFALESLRNCREPFEPKVLWEMTTVTIHHVSPNPGQTGSHRQAKRHSSHQTYKSSLAFGSHISPWAIDTLQITFWFFIFLYGEHSCP